MIKRVSDMELRVDHRIEDPIRCAYADCVRRHPVALWEEYAQNASDSSNDERITCDTCRKDMGLPPIEEDS